MAYQFVPGSWVWIQDEEERYLPAKVKKQFKKGDATQVQTEDGESRNLSPADTMAVEDCNPEALDSTIMDLVNISDLNEMSILHNLRIRFKEDLIYTNISSILISVNPFKLLPLYTPERLEMYRKGSRELPPHVFAIASNSYKNMLTDNLDQSVVISGESGAGKSEATKLILQFLTDVSSKSSDAGSVEHKSSALEQQILAANPILEAFGNAKTLRNNNSSRFGKLITVNFDKNGSITGGGIINYLLEKSRVVVQTKGERNYHIFYQLLSAADTDPAITAEFKLQAPDLFAFTSQSGVTNVEGISDEKDFEDVANSMDILQFSADEKHTVFKIVAGVLHFGNIKFKVDKKSTGDDGSLISNRDVLEHACKMWECDPVYMERFLTHRHIGTRSKVLVPYSVNHAQDARDAMVKKVYTELFQFLVDKINVVLSMSGIKRHKFIGVLDIFGFESFAVNSFEQLCINFCNEKLQFHFNEHIFKMEQSLYKQEGIVIPGTAFVDNQPTLDLLELKVSGIFSMTDEEINVPKGSDSGLLAKIYQRHGDGKHPNLVRPKAKDVIDHLKNFGILHYAGVVFYNADNFLEKNKDTLHSDIIEVLQCSKLELVTKMFPVEEAEEQVGRGKTSSKKRTLGFQFKSQLNDLIATLNSTSPHFVRCMKSNDEKAGNLFTSGRMQDQLRYAGLVEVCRIRKLGFPVRRLFNEFYNRFRPIDLMAPNLDALIKALLDKGVLKDGEWAKGNTRVFMRTAQSQALEIQREKSLEGVAIIIQKFVRRFINRRRYKRYKKIIIDLAAAIAKRNEITLSHIIDLSFELPHGGQHVKVVNDAKVLIIRLREEKKCTNLLVAGIQARDINSLKSALSVHMAMDPPFETPLAEEATILLNRLEEEMALRAALIAAIAARERSALVTHIQRAKAMVFECNEVSQASALLERLDLEVSLLASLSDAMNRNHLDDINTSIQKCMEAGNMEVYYPDQLRAASELKNVLYAKEVAREEERKRRESKHKEV
jgi:myosin heavy subunit